jgi:Ca2+-binding RTX toxin-like protein
VIHPLTIIPPAIEANVLVVEGTPATDTILVRPRAGSPTDLEVLINGNQFGPFSPTGGIRVIGYEGNDRITIDGAIVRDAFLEGGDGNDTLTGALGNDLLFGGAGADRLSGRQGNDVLTGGTGADILTGGLGRDVMIGGEGADRLVGYGGDVLVAGRTVFDLDPAALAALRDEWASARSYQARVANLRGESNPQFANRLNGNSFLRTSGTSPTVLDDLARDTLVGGAGLDWFLVNRPGGVPDVVVGREPTEIKDS